ncbi:hypothetical protein PM082_021699, partial [Marasmius tenuissimus]
TKTPGDIYVCLGVYLENLLKTPGIRDPYALLRLSKLLWVASEAFQEGCYPRLIQQASSLLEEAPVGHVRRGLRDSEKLSLLSNWKEGLGQQPLISLKSGHGLPPLWGWAGVKVLLEGRRAGGLSYRTVVFIGGKYKLVPSYIQLWGGDGLRMKWPLCYGKTKFSVQTCLWGHGAHWVLAGAENKQGAIHGHGKILNEQELER